MRALYCVQEGRIPFDGSEKDVKEMSTAIKIPFATQENGYDRNQVDRYVQKLADEYRGLQQMYNDLVEQRSYTPPQPQPAPVPQPQPQPQPQLQASRPDVNAEAIGKALVDAEVKAIQIVTEAKSEASRIIGSAYSELGKIQQEKERVIVEINGLMRKLKDIVPNMEN